MFANGGKRIFDDSASTNVKSGAPPDRTGVMTYPGMVAEPGLAACKFESRRPRNEMLEALNFDIRAGKTGLKPQLLAFSSRTAINSARTVL